MNIAFWIPILLAVGFLWVIATGSLFSARVGKGVVKVYENVKRGIEVEEKHE